MKQTLKNLAGGAVLSLFAFALVLMPLSADAKTVKVKSYFKPSTSSYVNSYYKTSPNKTKLDNYSTKGNYNPYTGKAGTKNYWSF